MHTLFDLPTLPLAEAIALAARLAECEPDAWEVLDGVLRSRVVAYLQEREGDEEALQDALLAAGRAARGRWQDRWAYLMDVLRDGSESHAHATTLRTLAADQWAGRVLRVVAEQPPTPRKRIRERFPELGDTHLTNVLAQLEQAGLVERSRSGRETTLLLTPDGREAARMLLPGAPEPAVEERSAPRGPTAWRDLAYDPPGVQ